MSRSFSQAWLGRDPRALALGPLDWRDVEVRRRHVAEHPGRPVAPAVLAALAAQNPAQGQRLEALARPGTLVVATGQQVGLFGGPLYAVYKAATAVALARALAAESGREVVPLFWLQTEDHDFAEIDHCHVLAPGQPMLRLAIAGQGAERRSVAHRRLGEDVLRAHAALDEAFAGSPDAAGFLATLRARYTPGATLAEAFAGLFEALFADQGLLLLSPRCAEIAPLAAEVHARALGEHEALAAGLVARGRALAAVDCAEQIAVRAQASLSFFHPDGADGDRFRLERCEGGWALPDGRAVSGDRLRRALAETPLELSTSALLRPILQDTLLPVAAYVGGPGELAYFGQLGPLYRHFGLPQPMFALRARLRVLDDGAVALLGKLGLRAADVEGPRDALLAKIARPSGEPEALERQLLADFDIRISEYEARAADVERGLVEGARRARAAVHRTIGRLAARHARALREGDRVAQERTDRLSGLLFPGGAPQERVLALPSFACRVGARGFLGRVLAAIDPLEMEIKELTL